MAVKYRRWDADDRVSAPVVRRAQRGEADGVAFFVTDGHRTMDEQRDRWNTFQHFGGPVAAFPSPTAPHIRSGRPDHAIDVDSLDGGAGRLAAWLRSATAPARRSRCRASPGTSRCRATTSCGSPTKLGDPLVGYPAKERHWIRTYDALVRRKRAGDDPADGPERRSRAAPPDDRSAARRSGEPPSSPAGAASSGAPASARCSREPRPTTRSHHHVRLPQGPPARHHRRPDRRRASWPACPASPRC